jgi:TIP41-like family
MVPQVRVMPNCWYVLLRFFLRVDRLFVRLREARLFCDLRQVEYLWQIPSTHAVQAT